MLAFYGPAQALEEALGISSGLISLADEEDHAVAFVMLLARPDASHTP